MASLVSESVHVADETIHYIAQRRRGTAREDAQELSLSGKWADAGVKLAALGASDLADLFFLKAQFWADPDRWTDADVERADQAGRDFNRSTGPAADGAGN